MCVGAGDLMGKDRRRKQKGRQEAPDKPEGPSSKLLDLQSLFNAVKPGSVLQLPPGTYAGGARLRKPNVTVRGGFGVEVKGGRDGIRLMPEAKGSTLQDLLIRNAETFGAFLGAAGATVRNCRISGSGRTGVLTAGVSDVTVEGNTIDNCREEHGIYASEGGTNVRILNNTISDTGKAGVQVNGEPNRFRGVVVRGNRVRRAKSFGLQVFATSNAVIGGNDLEGAHGPGALWDLGREEFRCEDIDLSGQADADEWEIADSCRRGLVMPSSSPLRRLVT